VKTINGGGEVIILVQVADYIYLFSQYITS